LCVQFDTANFLKGAPLDQMNYVKAGVEAGILDSLMKRVNIWAKLKWKVLDELKQDTKVTDPIAGSSPQDTGGGGGNQRNKLNIGK
jgi:hypothetical protein